jgi:hypothetical protein
MVQDGLRISGNCSQLWPCHYSRPLSLQRTRTNVAHVSTSQQVIPTFLLDISIVCTFIWIRLNKYSELEAADIMLCLWCCTARQFHASFLRWNATSDRTNYDTVCDRLISHSSRILLVHLVCRIESSQNKHVITSAKSGNTRHHAPYMSAWWSPR